jgi:hypothetical protein
MRQAHSYSAASAVGACSEFSYKCRSFTLFSRQRPSTSPAGSPVRRIVGVCNREDCVAIEVVGGRLDTESSSGSVVRSNGCYCGGGGRS